MTPDKFRTIRKNLGLKQADMAVELGYRTASISLFERARVPIPRAVMFAMHWMEIFGLGLPEEKRAHATLTQTRRRQNPSPPAG